MKKVGIIDCDVGNFFSLENALKHLNIKFIISKEKNELKNCTHLILPGVGAFSHAMKSLKNSKMDKFIRIAVLENKPLLGICLGMQLLFEKSNEFGNHEGLSLIKGKVVKINPRNFNIPIIGWQKICANKKNFLKSWDQKFVYLVHSYECIPLKNQYIISSYTVGKKKIVCAVKKKNIIGVQFHPEKSSFEGLKIFKKFINL